MTVNKVIFYYCGEPAYTVRTTKKLNVIEQLTQAIDHLVESGQLDRQAAINWTKDNNCSVSIMRFED